MVARWLYLEATETISVYSKTEARHALRAITERKTVLMLMRRRETRAALESNMSQTQRHALRDIAVQEMLITIDIVACSFRSASEKRVSGLSPSVYLLCEVILAELSANLQDGRNLKPIDGMVSRGVREIQARHALREVKSWMKLLIVAPPACHHRNARERHVLRGFLTKARHCN